MPIVKYNVRSAMFNASRAGMFSSSILSGGTGIVVKLVNFSNRHLHKPFMCRYILNLCEEIIF